MNDFTKTIILIAGSLFLGLSTQAQTDYKVYDDDPSPAKFVMNLDLFQFDVSKDGSSINFGTWGYYEVVDELVGVDFLLEKSYYTSEKKAHPEAPWNIDVELGGYYNFLSWDMDKNVKIILDVASNRSSTTTTSIKVAGTKLNIFSARGGMIYKRNPFDNFALGVNEVNNRAGTYGGIAFASYKNTAANVDGWGRYRTTGAWSIYADLLFMSRSITPIDIPVLPTAEYGSTGWRVGMKFFEAEPEDDGGGASLTHQLQIGMRPYTGFFLTYGIGMSIGIRD